jgi:hypothetical protein
MVLTCIENEIGVQLRTLALPELDAEGLIETDGDLPVGTVNALNCLRSGVALALGRSSHPPDPAGSLVTLGRRPGCGAKHVRIRRVILGLSD